MTTWSRCWLCWSCGAMVVSRLRTCRRCLIDIGYVLVFLLLIVGTALSAFGCASRPPLYRYHYESPLPEPLLPTPWCHEVLNPVPGAHCLVCLDEPGDREQIGRGSGEPCLRKAVATWGQPK